MASPIYQHQELQVHGLDCGAGDACAHACREGGHRILDVVDMMVMMDMMVDVTRGCLYTTHACREGGHLILDFVDMLVDKICVLLCALGLGEIGPEDLNFKIKTCAVGF